MLMINCYGVLVVMHSDIKLLIGKETVLNKI